MEDGGSSRRQTVAECISSRRRRSVCTRPRMCTARSIIVSSIIVLEGILSIAQAQTQNAETQPTDPNHSTNADTASPNLPAISDAVNPQAALDYVVQEPLFGDLPFRQRLHDEGINLAAHYISETTSNSAGFKGTGTDYAQQVDFGISFDLAMLSGWSDAIARFAMSDRAGQSTADRTGSYFAYQEIFGQGQNLRFDEISIEKTLPTQALAVKLGFYPLGNDFATLPYVCNFINVAFCGHPQSLPGDSGWSDGPAGRWGGRIKWLIIDGMTLQAGVFDVNPLVTRAQDGFKLGVGSSTGVIVPIELGYQVGKTPSDYGGTYKIGAYYDSSATADLAKPTETDEGRYGLYIEVAQQVFKSGPDLRNGLAVFAIYTISDQNTAKFKDYVEAGAAYRGMIPGRGLDLVSLGYVRTDINSRFQSQLAATGQAMQSNEELVEFNYTIQVIPSLTLRPEHPMQRPAWRSRKPSRYMGVWVSGEADLIATLTHRHHPAASHTARRRTGL